MHTGRLLITSIAAGLGSTTSALLHAPWWLSTMAFGSLILGLIVVAIQSVIPQESAHRLAWWRDRRRHQQVCRQISGQRARPEPAPRTADETRAAPGGHDA
ncbi:hypothetical protein ACFYOF_43170 [Streptomyces sp. NPDC007148]|uniref:hypothetical protein n=1 Tax=Streptomyces sp. NPDC007148 TaxID=3364775 RepID=UPI00367E4994